MSEPMLKRSLACPTCGERAGVINSRHVSDGANGAGVIRRRRRCPNNHRFSTYEIRIDNQADALKVVGLIMQYRGRRP